MVVGGPVKEVIKNCEYRDGIPVAWSIGGSHRAETSIYDGAIGAIFYGFDKASFLKSLLSGIIFGNAGVYTSAPPKRQYR